MTCDELIDTFRELGRTPLGEGTHSSPCVDAGRLYVAARQRDGFYDVLVGNGPRTQKDDNNQDFITARGQLLLTPNNEVSVRVIADYTNRYESCCAATLSALPSIIPSLSTRCWHTTQS